MAQTRMGNADRQRASDSTFECSFCETKHASRTIAYDALGYPICPVCEYDHRPT